MSTVREFYARGLADGALSTATAGARDSAFNATAGAPTLAAEAITFPAAAAGETASWTGLALAAASVRFYLTVGATLATVPFIGMKEAGGTRICGITISSTPQFALRNAANSAVATSSAFTPGDFVVELRYDAAAGTARAIVYNPDGTTFWDSGDQAVGTTANVGQVVLGKDSSTTAGPFTVSKPVLVDVAATLGLDPVTIRRVGPIYNIDGAAY